MKRALGLIFAVVMLFTAVFAFAGEKRGELLLGYDNLSGLLLPNSVLAAGRQYYFPVFISTNGTPKPLSDELMQKYSFKITNLSGKNGVKEFGFTKRNGYYYISVMAPQAAQPRYSLTLVERASGMDTLSLMVEFEVRQMAQQLVANPPTNAVSHG